MRYELLRFEDDLYEVTRKLHGISGTSLRQAKEVTRKIFAMMFTSALQTV